MYLKIVVILYIYYFFKFFFAFALVSPMLHVAVGDVHASSIPSSFMMKVITIITMQHPHAPGKFYTTIVCAIQKEGSAP